jgi:tRNA pseudouridine(55) synthase
MTSHDAVQKVRRILRQKRVGHTGTLDPDATGLLVLTLGKATRLTRFFIQAPKVYEGTVRFGIATDTYDASGEVLATRPVVGLTAAGVRGAMAELEGTYEQTPPPYCAKKIHGVKYYELARRGEEVPLEPKEVTVYGFEMLPEAAGDQRGERALVDGRWAGPALHADRSVDDSIRSGSRALRAPMRDRSRTSSGRRWGPAATCRACGGCRWAASTSTVRSPSRSWPAASAPARRWRRLDPLRPGAPPLRGGGHRRRPGAPPRPRPDRAAARPRRRGGGLGKLMNRRHEFIAVGR